MSFVEMKEQARREWNDLHHGGKPQIYIGTATCGRSAGSLDVMQTFQEELKARDIDCNLLKPVQPSSGQASAPELSTGSRAELFDQTICLTEETQGTQGTLGLAFGITACATCEDIRHEKEAMELAKERLQFLLEP